MSEQKRASLSTIGTVNSEKKSDVSSKKTVRLVVTLSEPNEDSCPVLDYTKLCRSEEKKQLQKKQKKKPNGTLLQFDEDDDDVRRIARQFEEKYGTGDKKCQSRCQTYSELGAGYDENDSFIDNTDAYDEALPEELQTSCGGYYINSGRLEFKRVEMSDHSDIDEINARRRKKGIKVIDEDEDEEEENEAEDVNEEEKSVKVAEEPKKEDVVPPVPKKVKISEDKPAEQTSSVINVKDKPISNMPDLSEVEQVKAKKRKLQMQGMPEDTTAVKQKKKALTVKALLEEKRVFVEPSGTEEPKKPVTTIPSAANYTSINDVIESVIRGKEDSNSSSAISKSHSGSVPSSETEESQESKPPSNTIPSPPLPDSLPPEVLEVVFRIKHLAATTFDLTRKVLSEDINNSLISLEWKIRDLPSALRHSLYARLSCYLPLTKDTLMKRTKKLIVQREEEKMKEPMKKLKAAVDAMMPILLEKYNNECRRLAEEQGREVVGNNTPSSKVARRKFPWNDELRGYLRELITVQLQCFNVLKLRKESSEAFVTKFLNTHVRVLWPPGWMKTSTLLREGRGSSVLKVKKHSSNGMESSNKNSNSAPRLTHPSLPSSTTLTPANGTTIPAYSRSESSSYQLKLPSATSLIPSTPLGTKSATLESNNLLSKITSLSSSISPPKKSHSPGNSVTISPVKKESFSVDALLKKNIEAGYSPEMADVKKESVSVITVNGSPMPFKDLPLTKIKKEEASSNSSGDKILDLSNCMSKQHHSVIQNLPSSDRTAVTNGESVNLGISEDTKPVVNSGLPSSKPKEAMASLLMSRKQRILQDSQSDDVIKSILVQEPARHNETTVNNDDLRKHRKSGSKRKHKTERDKEIHIPPPASKCIKSPPPYITSQEAERRLNEETATATDILSQIINESLLNTAPLQHQRSYEEEIPEERKMKPRTLSGDQDAKVNQEVDQVIQDLVELRQMSGGNMDNTLENSKSNYNSNPLGLHHVKSHDTEETNSTKLSPYSGFQDEFFKHLLKKDTPLPTITKPAPLPRLSIGPFDNSSPYIEDIPNKPSLYNSLPHHTNQSMSQHSILPPTSKSIQMNHGNPNPHSLPTGHPHRPVYFPPLGFSNDDQHLLGLTNNLQFGWPFPGSSEPSPPH